MCTLYFRYLFLGVLVEDSTLRSRNIYLVILFIKNFATLIFLIFRCLEGSRVGSLVLGVFVIKDLKLVIEVYNDFA
jgi:hypothetical protein